MQYNPNTVNYVLFSLNKENITEEEWTNQEMNKNLILEVAILEIDNL